MAQSHQRQEGNLSGSRRSVSDVRTAVASQGRSDRDADVAPDLRSVTRWYLKSFRAADPDFEQAEFALAVASDWQRRGYGELLMRHVLAYATSRGIKRVVGHVLPENHAMLGLAERVGFLRALGAAGDSDLTVVKSLSKL